MPHRNLSFILLHDNRHRNRKVGKNWQKNGEIGQVRFIVVEKLLQYCPIMAHLQNMR
jgi:hypothetical protein